MISEFLNWCIHIKQKRNEDVRVGKIKVTFVETNCKKNGPIKQTLNIIRNMDKEVFEPSLVTVWSEDADNSMIDEYKKLGIPVLSANMSKKKSVLFGKFIMPLQIGKTPIVVPRQHQFNEHVNDHQVEFVRNVAQRMGTIIPVEDINTLGDIITNYDQVVAGMGHGMSSNNAKFNEELEKNIEEIFQRRR